jgi:hypothetical protein
MGSWHLACTNVVWLDREQTGGAQLMVQATGTFIRSFDAKALRERALIYTS